MTRRITFSALAALVAAAVAAFVASAGGAHAAAPKQAGNFRHVLASKLGAELNQPAADVLVALKAANQAAKADKLTRHTPGQKLTREQRAQRRAAAAKRRADWTAAFAKSLDVDASAVKAAVGKLVKQRLDSLVADGWITSQQAARRADKLWIGFLRAGVR
jgi:hypothetical protein